MVCAGYVVCAAYAEYVASVGHAGYVVHAESAQRATTARVTVHAPRPAGAPRWQRAGERAYVPHAPRQPYMTKRSDVSRVSHDEDAPRVPRASGAVAIARATALARAEGPVVVRRALEVEVPVERRLVTVAVTREGKEALDAVQAWYSFQVGRRVTQHELFDLVLADALENEGGRFFRMSARSWV